MRDCVFCKIVLGDIPCYKVYEDDGHMAFLTMWPNTEGFTVVITKDHHDSYFANVAEDITGGLIAAAKTVAKKIDAAYDDVGRTGLVFEGFGVDHLHAKLVPMHGTNNDSWKDRVDHDQKVFYDQYPGYISSHDAVEMDSATLEGIAKRISNS